MRARWSQSFWRRRTSSSALINVLEVYSVSSLFVFSLVVALSHAFFPIIDYAVFIMDPLSIAASVAGLVTLTAQVSSSIVTYIKAAKDHTKGINQIAQELNSMQLVLEQLEELLKSQSMKKTSFAQSSVLANAIMSCKDSVQAISEKLPKPTQSSISHIIEKLKWPFTEKETQKKFEILQRYTSTFSFSLTVEDW